MKGDVDLSLINRALILERTRFQNYKNMSKEVSNLEGKEVLIKLAKIEKKHYVLLKKQIKSLRKFNQVNLDAIKDNEIKLLKKEKNFRRATSSIDNDINLVKKAEVLERGDPPFYDHLSTQTKDKGLKKVFSFLEKEEAKHLKVLKSKVRQLENLSLKLSVANDPRAMFYEMTR